MADINANNEKFSMMQSMMQTLMNQNQSMITQMGLNHNMMNSMMGRIGGVSHKLWN